MTNQPLFYGCKKHIVKTGDGVDEEGVHEPHDVTLPGVRTYVDPQSVENDPPFKLKVIEIKVVQFAKSCQDNHQI